MKCLTAVRDLRLGWSLKSSWSSLSNQTIRTSYRRTVLGPFWITFHQICFVLGLSLIYSQIFGLDISDYIPVASFGFAMWTLISHLFLGASNSFIQHTSAIRSSTLPYSFYLFQSLFTDLLTFTHSVLALLLIPVFFSHAFSVVGALTSFLVLLLTILNGLFMGLWLGPLCSRFRDVKALVPTALQVMLFISPVFWTSDQIPDRQWLVKWNPLAWFLESFRSPLIGTIIHTEYLNYVILMTVVHAGLGFFVFSKCLPRLSYWV